MTRPIRIPVLRPMHPADAWEHTTASCMGNYPRFLRPVGPRLGDHQTMNASPVTSGDLLGERQAVLSPCGTYRYALWRRWEGGDGTCLFVMLNPSTGDAFADDPTLRRCIGFARRWGYAALAVGNLFAYRSPDPDALRTVADPVGPENYYWLERLVEEADQVVVAWGAAPAAVGRAAAFVCRLVEAGVSPMCLGYTASGAPRHPLYLAKETARMRFLPDANSPPG